MGAWGALAGAALGSASYNEKVQAARKQNAETIATTRASPFISWETGQSIQPGEIVQAPSQFDSMLQGAVAGYSAGTGAKNMFAAQKAEKDAKKKDENSNQSANYDDYGGESNYWSGFGSKP